MTPAMTGAPTTARQADPMRFAPEAAGPHDPETSSPRRLPGSIRRTTSIDSARPDGVHGVTMLDARARDVRTDMDGAIVLVGEDGFRADVDPSWTIQAIAGDEPRLAQLIGAGIRSGFRARLAEVISDHATTHSLLHLLLDDLPGAILVTGYAGQRTDDGVMAAMVRDASDMIFGQADICAGWAADASILTIYSASREVPVPLGPIAPELIPADDAGAWHAMDPLGPHGMRRRRRLDLGPVEDDGRSRTFDAHFRDSHLDEHGVETALHEYTVAGRLDAVERRITAIEARARVLPWMECPGAVASAGRLVDAPLAGLRAGVRRDFVGVSTCTHLNDTLRSLEDLETLLDLDR